MYNKQIALPVAPQVAVCDIRLPAVVPGTDLRAELLLKLNLYSSPPLVSSLSSIAFFASAESIFIVVVAPL